MTLQAESTRSRLIIIDAWRGFAVLLMVIYHFCFDLSHFGLANFNFYLDPFWLHLRTFILSQFLLLVGIGLVLSTKNSFQVQHFLRRLGWLVASAGLISLSTGWMFGDRLVTFGVLHFIIVASILGLLFVRKFWLSLLLGLVLIVAGNFIQFSWFNQPAWNWIGLMTHKPATEDYVPLLPWFGVVLLGISASHFIIRQQPRIMTSPAFDNAHWAHLLALTGRHSLLVYMLHQPVLMTLLYIWVKLAT